jgi:GNAT superfamily N-acetyltransferase
VATCLAGSAGDRLAPWTSRDDSFIARVADAEPKVRELEPPDTRLAFEAMRALRPALVEEADFVTRIDQVQRPERYRLVGSFDRPEGPAAGVAGFRTGSSLAWGRFLYVDDLATLPQARRRGHAGRLLDWLLDEARRLECNSLHLDALVGPSRVDAHRLYLNRGLSIAAHHFYLELDGQQGAASG